MLIVAGLACYVLLVMDPVANAQNVCSVYVELNM